MSSQRQSKQTTRLIGTGKPSAILATTSKRVQALPPRLGNTAISAMKPDTCTPVSTAARPSLCAGVPGNAIQRAINSTLAGDSNSQKLPSGASPQIENLANVPYAGASPTTPIEKNTTAKCRVVHLPQTVDIEVDIGKAVGMQPGRNNAGMGSVETCVGVERPSARKTNPLAAKGDDCPISLFVDTSITLQLT
ncbi:hypothetical protein QAD02_014176 [Eretmocerus hayati]|uniref:Uncharacterized protein n=1 Tax=Eretmocerus hayati TaxID=131215 RepID=A0ACC2P4Z4_9HYME|nr:hypothetical protein QAD02_014176 [Eretmocerus hayati]